MSEAAVAPARRETEQPGAATTVLRRTMVDRQLRPFDVTDVPIIERFLDVPRELFLPERLATIAYSDLAATLHPASGVKRSLLPPLVLARMIQAAAPRPDEKALVIGGAGYSAAVLANLVGSVVAVESDAGRMSHPTVDHYLPLLYVMGAADPRDAVRFPITGFDLCSLSMRALILG